ncbi:GNAT family N-acetyltransferase [Paenibacillus albidus]|uniref:GNAT family N-acetyltransferase n=1 Tax=Paenibacillus albidus TaxID=2041023 RepID=UPI001BE5C907|nr:GNAT family N-acetyltransferase [Paenibacillus albidus]MBT2290924.1 GNAT family N-acetyltransferase [Paenibacillus albidus]
MFTAQATPADLSALVRIDSCVIGNDSRKSQLANYIRNNQCVLGSVHGEPAGFACYDTSFFGCCFIQLVIVSPDFRRQGVARALIQYIIDHCPTGKLFTSTNASNSAMQQVCFSMGFIPSGIIENLDEGDPEWVYFIETSNGAVL